MPKLLTLIAAGAALLTCGAVVAIADPVTDPGGSMPPDPRIGAISVDPPKVDAPDVATPRAPRLELQPTTCASAGCDPRRLAGTVIGFDGTTLTLRADVGRTYRAVVDADTHVACPPQEAIDQGRVFNPATPEEPRLGAGSPTVPADIRLRDRYACSTSEIATGRRVVGAAVGFDSGRRLHWLGVALAPR